jgi:ADP-glucose pyrophosphorylase
VKRTLTILVVVATLFASFSKAFVMGAFLINQANISKTLCENRNQPKKHCEGKCYLKKQMTKDEKKDKSSVPFSINDIFQEFVWVNTPVRVFHYCHIAIVKKIQHLSLQKPKCSITTSIIPKYPTLHPRHDFIGTTLVPCLLLSS